MTNETQWVRVGSYRVDTRLLEWRLVARCRIENCQAACCGHGVYVDVADATRIMAEAGLIRPYLPANRRDENTWFEGGIAEDRDFPTGYKVGTNVVTHPQSASGSKCVFLGADYRCGLQSASIGLGRHPWDLKPFYCALYPLIVSGDILQLDDDNELFSLGGTCQAECSQAVPLYELFKDEIILVLGQEGYGQLCALDSAGPGTVL